MPVRYEVEISPSAGRELRKLPPGVQDRLIPAIRDLATDPRPRWKETRGKTRPLSDTRWRLPSHLRGR